MLLKKEIFHVGFLLLQVIESVQVINLHKSMGLLLLSSVCRWWGQVDQSEASTFIIYVCGFFQVCVCFESLLQQKQHQKSVCVSALTQSLQAPNRSAPLMSAESAQQSCFTQCGGGRAETTVHPQSLKVRHKRDAAEQAQRLCYTAGSVSRHRLQPGSSPLPLLLCVSC